MQLSNTQHGLHIEALALAKKHRDVEASLIQILQKIDDSRLYKKLGQPSLFMYATNLLKLSEPVAYAFIAVARKAKEVPELKAAICSHNLSVSKASRITSQLQAENAIDLIEFASKHTTKEIDFEMAKRNPRALDFEKIKPISEDQIQITITISRNGYENLKRAEALQAQKGKKLSKGETIEYALDVLLDRQDPVRKAERNKRKQNLKLCLNRVPSNPKPGLNGTQPKKRTPLTAAQKNAVAIRDKGRCTHTNLKGERCNQDRWTQTHHVVRVADGGGNEPENLTTLCYFHHDLVHQLSLPIDGQVSSLRSPGRPYIFNAAR